MNGNTSWEVNSYQEGKWRVSVRHNPENDRIDEGDSPDPSFHAEKVDNSSDNSSVFDIYMNDFLVAEVRGNNPENRIIIPMRQLCEEEQEELYRFLDEKLSVKNMDV
jgi:hypothetical protein